MTSNSQHRRYQYRARMAAAAFCAFLAVGCSAVAVFAFSAYPAGALEDAQRRAWDCALAVPFAAAVMFVWFTAALTQGNR